MGHADLSSCLDDPPQAAPAAKAGPRAGGTVGGVFRNAGPAVVVGVGLTSSISGGRKWSSVVGISWRVMSACGCVMALEAVTVGICQVVSTWGRAEVAVVSFVS